MKPEVSIDIPAVALPQSQQGLSPSDKDLSLTIRNWDEADRPREKLSARGADSLTPAELLAILIGSGTPQESAVSLMQRIMKDCNGSLRRLGRMSIAELCRYKGIGEAKAITILAACELGKRRAQEPASADVVLNSPEVLYEYFLPRMEDLAVEEFHILLLRQNLSLISDICIGRGGLTATAVDVRVLLREALLAKATAIVMCHNHPSGSTNPSQQDDLLTMKVKRAVELMDIHLIDHIIMGDRTFFSYNQAGRL